MKIGRKGEYFYLSGSGTALDGKYLVADVRPAEEVAKKDNPQLGWLDVLLVAFAALKSVGKHTPAPRRRRNGQFARKRRKPRRTALDA